MWSYVVAMVGLGVLGFDPAPGLIALAALALGARRRDIVLFGVLLIGGTAAWGVALTAVAGRAIRRIHWFDLAVSPLGLLFETVVAVAIATWSVVVLVRRSRASSGSEVASTQADPDGSDARAASRIASGVVSLSLVALVFVAVVIGDPPFPAAVVASAGRTGGEVVLGFLLWALVSQWPLAVVALAVGLGRVGAVTALGRRWRPRIAKVTRAVGPVLGLVVATAILVWVGTRLAAGA